MGRQIRPVHSSGLLYRVRTARLCRRLTMLPLLPKTHHAAVAGCGTGKLGFSKTRKRCSSLARNEHLACDRIPFSLELLRLQRWG
mmetsp:Transcript_15454/g.27411  ORF Transcript_15454/g.27411 Transcript_15454/m.27411 type:complete len:85 (-) Transcript_15454:92-346(-)